MIWHSPSAGFSQKIYYQLHPASLALRVCIQILVSSCKSHVKRVRSLEGKRCITRWRKQGLERDRVYGRKQSREEIVKDLEHLLKEVTRVPANRKVLTAIAVQYWPHYIMIECFWESKCIAFFLLCKSVQFQTQFQIHWYILQILHKAFPWRTRSTTTLAHQLRNKTKGHTLLQSTLCIQRKCKKNHSNA